MKHPMYNEADGALIAPLVKDLNNSFLLNNHLLRLAGLLGQRKLGPSDVNSIMTRVRIFSKIPKNGHVLISVDNDDWVSDITQKTFEKLKMQDLKIPFGSGAIKLGDRSIFFSKDTKEEVIEFSNKNDVVDLGRPEDKVTGVFNISYHDPVTHGLSYVTIEDTELILNNIEDPELKELITTTLSVLFYITTFRDIKDRTSERNIVCKKSAKRKIPKHTINRILLKQKIKGGESKESSERTKSDKRWLVRGHWRNQYYKSTDENKMIWIDPYWKGSGNEIINKEYILGDK